MPISVVRAPSTHVIRSLRIATLAVAALFAASCGGNTLSGPGDARLSTGPDGRTAGPSGLEQRLTAVVEPAPAGDPYTAQLLVTSTIVNTGSTSVKLTARECLFQDDDVRTTAQMNRFEPFISCSAVSSARDLPPGQSSSPMAVRFGVRSGPGTYTLSLRHALTPEFRGEVSFQIP